MRKKIITPNQPDVDQNWLNLENIAEVEITSEDINYPIESALVLAGTSGWRAATTGEQVIRLIFDEPQKLTRIKLSFVETTVTRTQEYVLRYSEDNGQTFNQIMRQQWNFCPEGSTIETEDHSVDLQVVTVLELNIKPDIHTEHTKASLDKLQLA